MEIPSDQQGKRDLFRALRNVRMPKPVSEEFLRLQDEELQAQLQEKGIVDLTKPSTSNSKLSTTLNSKPSTLNFILWQGDITRIKVDAIVNAANSCISTGEFRFPNRLAAEIAVRTVGDYLLSHPNASVKNVVLNVFKDLDKEIYAQILAKEK